MENYKSGFIAIVGRPNAGKSTLLNALMKEKIAIMTDTPNTTRNNIAGILTKDDVQYVFVDTPGIHKPQQQLGRVLNKNAYTAMEDCDVIAWIVDITQRFGPGDEFILNRIKSLRKPVLLLVNKIDRFSKEKMIQALMAWQQKYDFDEIIPLSAKDQENLDEVLATIKNYLPDGPAMYPDEMKTDHDENFRICEVIREKILNKTEEEIPHSIAVVLEKKEIRDGKAFINALVIVDRDSQKGILIGKQGSMIKEIRIASQRELSKMLGMRIDLELYVRVEKNWRNKEQKIREFGLDELNEGTR
ncbi:GTPase Era [Dubosiella muris]|uniref:GTPase Era n=2 Tax=Dubosiella TaxID=1937008 RepID=A0AC61R9Y7_9FIRM|nr:GTPase Era [Dubosiella muris]TGY67124.1 GTPase Era [Dubosiella muris]